MQQSFINYSMSVIVSRALPDVRDGLKPVHRRILYAMNELGLVPGRPYKKSATVVGDVLGKYHPHGDSSVYDALVRMVQDFSLRYPLVDGQGNFGSVDGDRRGLPVHRGAADAHRDRRCWTTSTRTPSTSSPTSTTGCRSRRSCRRKVPNLLVNGSSGIAVGMATNIPPHNLREVAKAVRAAGRQSRRDDRPTCARSSRAPTSPPAATSTAAQGIKEAYETGRGRVIMRARAPDRGEGDRRASAQIVVTEIPLPGEQGTAARDIAELASGEEARGHLRRAERESDKDGMRLVIELKRDAIPNVVLNQLYKHTAMQSTFGVIMLALDNGAPKVMNLQGDPRSGSSTTATKSSCGAPSSTSMRAQAREHILDGLKIAVDNIDEVIKIIRGQGRTADADAKLRKRFRLSEKQSDAILNMRLAKLTGLEIEKLEAELAEVRGAIKELKSILASKPKRMGILKDEMDEVARKYGDDRRTEILADQGDFSVEDLIAEEDMVITISHTGYIKRIPVTTYRRQRRGGRGLTGATTKEDGLGRAPLHRHHARLPDVLHQHGARCTGSRCTRSRRAAARRAASRWSTASPSSPTSRSRRLVAGAGVQPTTST